jgi:ubiquinone/menaquinone biosynthesis C-methylase UbiE
MQQINYSKVTERGGELVSKLQLDRFYQRYLWAGDICRGKDVLEMACGTGPGLGYLQSIANNFSAGDISLCNLTCAQKYYGNRIDLHYFDATRTQFEDQSFDVIILFEAIYYIADIQALMTEVKRLLRPKGKFLITSANKDLFDFNPSPYSHRYYNAPELKEILANNGFNSCFYGDGLVFNKGISYKTFRWIKKLAVDMKLIPGSMDAKKIIKRFVFGKLVRMPKELVVDNHKYLKPIPISSDYPEEFHQVLYCISTKE